MRAARATAHNEKSSQVMPYISRLRVSTSWSTHHEGAEGGRRGFVLPGRYSAKAGSRSPWTMPSYVPCRHHRAGRDEDLMRVCDAVCVRW